MINISQHQLIQLYLANLEVNVTAVGYDHVWSDWQDIDYIPDYNKFYLICEGEGWLKIGDTEFTPKPGQWFLMPQGVKQSYSCTNGPRFKKYWCHFTARIGENNLFDILKVPFFIDICDDVEPIQLFSELITWETSDSMASPLLLKAALYKLIAYYVEHGSRNEEGIQLATMSEPLQEVVSYIHAHYSENLTIGELAEMVHLHPNYFIRVFKRHFGASPIKYVNKKRIEEAKWLLISTNHTLSMIGELIGIPDISYFSKLFRSMTGFSPSAFRQAHRQISDSDRQP
jgi:AraC-like DNA-binding protein